MIIIQLGVNNGQLYNYWCFCFSNQYMTVKVWSEVLHTFNMWIAKVRICIAKSFKWFLKNYFIHNLFVDINTEDNDFTGSFWYAVLVTEEFNIFTEWSYNNSVKRVLKKFNTKNVGTAEDYQIKSLCIIWGQHKLLKCNTLYFI